MLLYDDAKQAPNMLRHFKILKKDYERKCMYYLSI